MQQLFARKTHQSQRNPIPMYRKDYPKDPVEQPGEEVLEARCIGVRLLCV